MAAKDTNTLFYDQTTGDVIDTTTGEVVEHGTKKDYRGTQHFRKSCTPLDKLMEDTTYDKRERDLMLYMCIHANKNNLVKMNLKRLLATDDALREIGTSKTTIVKYLALLETDGYIKCTNPEAKGAAREYMVNPDYSSKTSESYTKGYLWAQWCSIQPTDGAQQTKIQILESTVIQERKAIEKMQKMLQRHELQLENMKAAAQQGGVTDGTGED